MDAVRYYTAMVMAERGVVSAPNMAVGLPFTIGSAAPTFGTEPLLKSDGAAAPKPG